MSWIDTAIDKWIKKLFKNAWENYPIGWQEDPKIYEDIPSKIKAYSWDLSEQHAKVKSMIKVTNSFLAAIPAALIALLSFSSILSAIILMGNEAGVSVSIPILLILVLLYMLYRSYKAMCHLEHQNTMFKVILEDIDNMLQHHQNGIRPTGLKNWLNRFEEKMKEIMDEESKNDGG